MLAAAMNDLAALLDYAGKHREATSLRSEITALSSGRLQIDRIRGGISVLRRTNIPVEARSAADDVVARIQRVLA